VDALLSKRLAVARGDEPADVVIRGGKVLSVFTREWLETDVAIADGWIAGLGGYEGRETIDASGKWVVPGFVDAHVHIESSKMLADEFARLVLPFGTTCVVADPHEIANVLGTDGVHWLLDATAGMPLDVRFTASSCVPASKFESPRRALNEGVRPLITEIRSSINYYSANDGSPLERISLTGGAAALRGLPGLLSAQLGVPTDVVDPMRRVRLAGTPQPNRPLPIVPTAVAVGLAMGAAA